jgi:glutaconate CoA-transferase subunit B
MLRISKLMPEVSVDQVLEETGFRPDVSPEVEKVKRPTEKELRVLREEVDPDELYIKRHE